MLSQENKRSDLTLLAISFSAMSLVGGFAVFTYWWAQNANNTGVTRVALFIAIMAAVHGLGAALYITQDASCGESQRRWTKSWTLRGSLWSVLVQYVFFLLIAALILDGGFMFRCFCIGVLAHGCLTGMICLRRASTPTGLDLALIRYGYVPVAIIVSRAVTFVHQWKGDLPW